MAGRILAHQHEVARIGDQDETVAFPIAADLGGYCGQPRIIAGGFDFDDTAFGDLSFFRLALLHLLGRIQPEVGMSRPLGRKFGHTERLGFQSRAHGVEQSGQRRIV